MRLSRAVAAAARSLAAAGVPSPRVDAELLAAHVLDTGRGRLVLIERFTTDQYQRYTALVARRAERVPLQHLVGSAAFANTEVAVGPGVFVPRPETELLVEWGLAALAAGRAVYPGGPVVVDLCAGSGAIALAVARALPQARVYAVERDPAALRWLRRNAGDTVTVVAADVAAPTLPDDLIDMAGRVDLVLANPPYIPDGTPLPPDVAGHDPPAALFGGEDGLTVIRPMLDTAARLLRPGGGFATEHDDSHGDAVPALLRADGRYTAIADHADLAGRPRFATARRA